MTCAEKTVKSSLKNRTFVLAYLCTCHSQEVGQISPTPETAPHREIGSLRHPSPLVVVLLSCLKRNLKFLLKSQNIGQFCYLVIMQTAIKLSFLNATTQFRKKTSVQPDNRARIKKK